jgi:hypothetical protein
VAGSGIFEVAERQAWPAEQRHLNEPVKGDRDLAEEIKPKELRRDEDVIGHQQRESQDARSPEDVEQVRQRREAPLGPVEVAEPVDEASIEHEEWEKSGQIGHTLIPGLSLKTHNKRRENG